MLRLRHNFRLAVIFLLGVTAVVTLCGFLGRRLLRGEWTEAAFDAMVVVGIVSIMRLAWDEKRLELAGTLMVAFNTAACIAASVVVGEVVNGWIYVALMTNFYIARPRMAAWSGLLLLVAATLGLVVRDADDYLSTVVTWALVYAFSYAFSRRIHAHSASLELRASRDPLTQMSNRGMLESRLQAIVSGQERGRVGLLILDLDHFKSINDEHGHAAGDAVLVALADVLHGTLRKDDSAYRFGGEEFVLILPVGSEDALAVAAERIRERVCKAVSGPTRRVTASIGGAMYGGEEDWQDWFTRADASLYRAKRAGRNRVCIAEAVIDE